MRTATAARNSVSQVDTEKEYIVSLDRETTATISAVEKSQLQRSQISIDGKVPWMTSILPRIRGEKLTVWRLYVSIQHTYGENSISRMRVYKYLNSLVKEDCNERVRCIPRSRCLHDR